MICCQGQASGLSRCEIWDGEAATARLYMVFPSGKLAPNYGLKKYQGDAGRTASAMVGA